MTPRRRVLLAYPVTAAIFLAMDAAWLSNAADRLYRPFVGQLMAAQFAVAPAVIFYAIYFVGVVFFAVAPSLPGRRWRAALGRGALLGLVAYGTYDLTNQATLSGWAWQVTVADLCWGSFATGVAAALACLICGQRGDRRRA